MLFDTPDQITQIAKQVDERATALRTNFNAIAAAVAAEKAKLAGRDKERLSSAASSEERGAIRQLAGVETGRALSKVRREELAEREKALAGIMGPVADWEASIVTTEALNQSAPQLLAREGLGDSRRSEIQRQLEHAGDATIRSMADLARAKGDLILAAAILAVQDAKPRAKRAIDLQEFSTAMVGDRLTALQHQLAELKEKLRGMRDLRTAIDRGTESADSKIRAGLAARTLAPKPDPRQAIGEAMRGQQ
jgi:hypothetical protein